MDKGGDSEDRQKKLNKLRDVKKAEFIRMYNLNVGNKYEGQMEDDVQIFSLGNELVMSGTNH